MSDDLRIIMPSRRMDPSVDRWGVLSGFEPGTRVLPAGYRTTPPFRPIPVEIVLDKDVAVRLRDGVTIHVDVLRPAGAGQVPVIVAWSPHGKGQGTSPSVQGIFGMVGLDNGIMSGLAKFEAPDPVPVHAFDTSETRSPGEVVQIEVDLLPVRLAFHLASSCASW